jgi:hypothetical protein
VPPLPPGGGFVIEMLQRSQADVVAMWSESVGEVTLLGRPSGADAFAPVPIEAGRADEGPVPGHSAIAIGVPAGTYRARLRNVTSASTRESRAVVFYDDQSTCEPEPRGAPEADPVRSDEGAAPTPSPAPVAPPTALAPPTPPPTPALLARVYVDCQPYVNGPSGYIEIRPIVWRDEARTIKGSLPVHATLIGPTRSRIVTDEFTAAPGAAPRRLELAGYGLYEFRLEAEGANLDANCHWSHDHDLYS